MSNRNSYANKSAARERLRAEREKQAKRDKIRRQLVVGGSIVAVLAMATGIGVAVVKLTGNPSKEWIAAAKKKSFVAPANTTGPQGTTVVIGKKDAKNTLEVFEDMRCPVCASFEQATGDTVLKDIKDGKYKASYTLGTFLDDNENILGSGSKNALSALGAALNVSPQAFLDYKKALYSVKNHPDETKDDFSGDDKLIEVAQQVKELKGNTSFEKAVNKGTYDRWALAMSKKFNSAKDVTGTPTFKLNGNKLTDGGPQGSAPMIPAQFNAAVDQVLQAKK